MHTTAPSNADPISQLWSPHEFVDQTAMGIRFRPKCLKEIGFMLENYHGIPKKELEDRLNLAKMIRVATMDAMASPEVHEERKKGLGHFLINLENEILECGGTVE